MNELVITNVTVEKNRIDVHFSTSGDIDKYFNVTENHHFYSEYSENIEGTPLGIAIIPFVANVLPLCWLTNTNLIVEDLDEDFYESIPEIKHGFIFMHRGLNFDGQVICKRIVKYTSRSNRTAVLFSGGVDAFATLLAHIDENPQLVTLWGADIKLNDIEGWNLLKSQVLETVKNLNLCTPIFVKSNFKDFLNSKLLDKLVHKSGDNYWHGFQHGIGISAHVAPVAAKYGLFVTYMASSFTCDYKGTAASDPIIEGHLRFASNRIFHDRYSYSRQEKIRLIVSKCRILNKKINLHVCWMTSGGNNCCACEKCCRTIYGILAEGANPCDFGFSKLTDASLKNAYNIILKDYSTRNNVYLTWNYIKAEFEKNGYFRDNPNINWIYRLKRDRKYAFLEKIKKVLRPLYVPLISRIKG